MRLLSGIALFAALTVGLAGCRTREQIDTADAATKAERDQLQGKWKVVGRAGDDEEGEEIQAEGGYYCIIDGDTMRSVTVGADGKEDELSRRKLTVMSGKQPKQVDLVYVDDSGKPIKEKKTKRGITGRRKTTSAEVKDVGIYKIDGNQLTFAISFDEKKRPADFNGVKGTSSYVLTLEKVKDVNPRSGESDTPATTRRVSGTTNRRVTVETSR